MCMHRLLAVDVSYPIARPKEAPQYPAHQLKEITDLRGEAFMKVKIVSWNIWLGRHLSEILTYLRDENAEIVGLQELDVAGDQVGQIARELGYQYVFFPASEETADTGKGNAVLSTFPIAASVRHDLSPAVEYDGTPTTEPRIAVEATVSAGDTPFVVYSTHLGYSAKFRPSAGQSTQAETLVNLVKGRSRVLLMGDFNSLPDSGVVQRLSTVLKHADPDLSVPTFTVYPHEYEDHRTDQLSDRVDYLLTSHDLNVVDAGVGMSRGSNHLPIWAVLEV